MQEAIHDYPEIREAGNTLLQVCDGARSEDGQGFNRFDSPFAQDVLSKSPWSIGQARAMYKVLRKYRKQLLSDHGIDYDEIPDPEDQAPKTRQASINDARNGLLSPASPMEKPVVTHSVHDRFGLQFRCDFPFDPEVKDAFRAAIDITIWDGDLKVWIVPGKCARQLLDFAKRVGWVWSDDALFEAMSRDRSLREEVKKRQEAIKASTADDSDFMLDFESKVGHKLFPYQRAGAEYLATRERAFLADEMGLGKAQPLDAKVLTPTGWVPIGTIKTGDKVIGSDGHSHSVTGVFPQGEKEVFEVKFSDGSRTLCCDDHLWSVQTAQDRFKELGFETKTLREIRKHLKNGYNRLHFVPMVKPVHFDTEAMDEVTVDPYLLGLLLGDGSFRHNSVVISNPNETIIEEARIRSGLSLEFSGGACDYRFTTPGNSPNPLLDQIRDLGLHGLYSHQKFVPGQYMMGDVSTRVEILRGLMDTDGYIMEGGTSQFTTTSKMLADAVQFMVWSLGGVARISSKIPTFRYKGEKKNGKLAYTLTINLTTYQLFKNHPNTQRQRSSIKYGPCRAMDSVTSIGKDECVCISVDADDNLYVTDDFIVTHNTVQALAAIHAVKGTPALIICPAAVTTTWKRHVQEWLPGVAVTVAPQRPVGTTRSIHVTSYDRCTRAYDDLMKLPWKTVVCDEAHALKNREAKRTQRICGHQDRRTGTSIPGLLEKAQYRFMLTGTPVPNRPVELIQPLMGLDRLRDIGGFVGYATRYCGWQKGVPGSIQGNVPENLPELNEKLRASCWVRRKKGDVMKDLPPKFTDHVPMPLSNEKEYQRALRNVRDFLDNDPGIAEAMVKLTVLRGLCAKGKVEAAMDWVENFIESGEKLVFFGWHKAPVKAIYEKFKDRAVILTGESSQKQRDQAVDAFQENDDVKLICCTWAAGEGITLTAASHMAFIELPWNPGKLDQASDRIHRIGQDADEVTYHFLLAEGTIDEDVAELIDAKRKTIKAIEDGEMIKDEELVRDLIGRIREGG